MKHLRYLLILTLFLYPFRQADAQEIADTIRIEIVGNVTSVVITANYVTPVRVGDTVLFMADVVDEDGDPISALLTYFTEDSTALRLEDLPDGQARGIALKKASVRVWVVAEPFTELRVASFRPPDSLNWSGADTIFARMDSTGAVLPGQPEAVLQMCAYLTRGGTILVAESPGPPLCPTVFLPATLPSAYLALSRPDRRMARDKFNRLARTLPVSPGEH